MIPARLTAAALTFVLAGCAAAQSSDPAPAEKPQTPAAKVDPAKVDPADAILKRLEQAGGKYSRLTAEVRFVDRDRLTGDQEIRTGRIAYQAGKGKESGKFAIEFDTYRNAPDAAPIADRVVYAFDGQWFSILKYRPKQQMRFQVAQKDQVVNPLKIGKGPFPMPIGQKAAEVKKVFTVSTEAPQLSRPQLDELENADYLCLTVKPEHVKSMDFVILELWVDRDSGLPVRMISHKGTRPSRRAIKRYSAAELQNVAQPEPFEPSRFLPPRQRGWTFDVKPLGQ
ncbi:MAG: LolA family protein [Phycisphaerae bacterium]